MSVYGLSSLREVENIGWGSVTGVEFLSRESDIESLGVRMECWERWELVFEGFVEFGVMIE